MTYDEFKNEFKNALETELNATVYIKPDTSIGQAGEMMSVRINNDAIGVVLHLDELFNRYQDDDFSKLVEMVRKAYVEKPSYNTDQFLNWDDAKQYLVIKPANIDVAGDKLADKPHLQLFDMAFMCALDIGNGIITVTDRLLETWGKTFDEVYAYTLEQERVNTPIVFNNVFGMTIATTKKALYGASILLQTEFFEKCKEQFGNQFYILPASIHELIIMGDLGEHDESELTEMVKAVNAEAVEPKDLLSNNAYYYDGVLKTV